VVNRDQEAKEERMAAVSWIFNAWGEKYPELMADAARTRSDQPGPEYLGFLSRA